MIGSLPSEAEPLVRRIAGGQGARDDAVQLFDLLHAHTRERITKLLAAAKGRSGTLDPKPHGNSGWSAGCPRGVVLHVPALWGRAALDSMDIARRFLIKSPSPKGTHVVVGWPDGELLVTGHPKDSAWHAGRWNASHLGIDVVSPGPLVPGPNGSWRRWDGQQAPIVRPDGSPLRDEDVLDLFDTPAWGHRYWHCPTPAQVFGTAIILRALRLYHPTVEPQSIIRHADVSANRVDPGPGIPLEALRSWVVGTDDLLELLDVLGSWPECAPSWHAFLLNQWRAPIGIVTGMDLRCPGRKVAEGSR